MLRRQARRHHPSLGRALPTNVIEKHENLQKIDDHGRNPCADAASKVDFLQLFCKNIAIGAAFL